MPAQRLNLSRPSSRNDHQTRFSRLNLHQRFSVIKHIFAPKPKPQLPGMRRGNLVSINLSDCDLEVIELEIFPLEKVGKLEQNIEFGHLLTGLITADRIYMKLSASAQFVLSPRQISSALSNLLPEFFFPVFRNHSVLCLLCTGYRIFL